MKVLHNEGLYESESDIQTKHESESGNKKEGLARFSGNCKEKLDLLIAASYVYRFA